MSYFGQLNWLVFIVRQQETADLQQQVLDLGGQLVDLQASVQEMKQASYSVGTRHRKGWIPKELSVSVLDEHVS